jgi:signal transduction histidine kinase
MTLRGFASRQTATGLLIGAAGIVGVTAAIALLKGVITPDGLTGLYLIAILPVAIRSGFVLAGVVAVASYLTFSFFFVPPLHSFDPAGPDTPVALTISLVTAYVVSELARRAHARAEDAEQAQTELRRLADEHSALRRVATLVAQAVPTAEVFEAVAREVGLQCDADVARMERFEPDGTVTALAAWNREGGVELAVGARFSLEGASIATQVLESGRPARVDSFIGASGPIAREAQALGIRSSVGCPIVVGGRAWGVIAASTTREKPFPPNTEARIADFTELVATAVSNAEARADLVASRARVLTAADEARRQVERDLHDGAQQRLVHAIITLKLARRELDPDDRSGKAHLAEALEQAEQANAELRQLAHGILPAALSRGGLSAAVESLVSRLRVPVEVAVSVERLPREIEASAYFVVAEALTNVAKHSGAQRARVSAWLEDGVLRVDVHDDGVGGARADGSGLVGLGDRVSTLGGHLRIDSPPGGGTRIAATLPVPR